MKIVAGLGSVDEYIRYCEAGADEYGCKIGSFVYEKELRRPSLYRGKYDGTQRRLQGKT